ncbi:uncharacterized protein LOC110963609 [Acanthochromis polyacanthus]|uniref:uncharacterized protein LOC110963609 n=1 Tax=Acanthochromis polyacanthus TaxID=80966 RepID=UPI000B8FBB12|nr:uncharacterized protein LOC110963609 [Acanthochromis polyacanthus]XP_051811586.1 uncharacterized protein LOC110963609 [Acanthochromis polyacanthus]XP_051811587.1 uncharacterized protein LOC110963609 [Acanthochromis polyacanthus]XP_051811588.1 uncharacterized protein LOC110963609 [Acanthochromis polyacanthus]
MSGPAGAAPPTAVLGLGLDVGGPWHQRSRALVQTFLLTGSMLPPPPPTAAAGGRPDRTPLRLPSLVSAAKGPRRRSSMARLSFSEPSLLTPNENVQFEGFSNNRRSSVLQKRPPPPPPFMKSSGLLTCRTCHPSGPNQPGQQQVQSCSRPTYIHFSQAIQPSSKPRPARRHSHNPALSSEAAQGDLRPSAAQYRTSPSQEEPLSVVGKPCLLSCSQRSAAVGPSRAQLHVFLPSEAEGEEADRESVDEGFMDDLDNKITSLKLQQGARKAVTHH